ncbi:MAG: OsmC family protein [Candidatus Obscuribacterales bacterium]
MMAEVTVKTHSEEQFKQDITAGTHSFICDIPKDIGGTEEGPDPHELLLSSLGACTSITVQMYAKRKGYPLKRVTVNLKEDKIADPENASRTIPKISRELKFEGELSEEQIKDLTAIADKCPIHKLITGPKEIATSVAN